MELVDTLDLKSNDPWVVRVQVPSSVQMKSRNESFDFFGFKKFWNARVQENFLKPKKAIHFLESTFLKMLILDSA